MRTYYLVATWDGEHIGLSITDNSRLGEVLLEIEAESYTAAQNRVSYTARSMGRAAIAGVRPNGEPYAEIV